MEGAGGARGARSAPSPQQEPMGRARGGRVRASPPFCESITRSRWVGSCYSGASTPSPAGLLCVQWTGESCLSALPVALLALGLSSRRRLGLLGAPARVPLRPGRLRGSGPRRVKGAGRSCRGREAAPAPQPGARRGAALPISGLPAARSGRTRRRRGPCRPPPAPRAASRASARPPGSRQPLRAPGVAPRAPRPGPARARVVLRTARAPARVRGLSRRLDSGPGLPRPRRPRERPGDAALRPEGRGPFAAVAGPSPGCPQSTAARPIQTQGQGGRLGEGAPRPLCYRLRGGLCPAVP